MSDKIGECGDEACAFSRGWQAPGKVCAKCLALVPGSMGPPGVGRWVVTVGAPFVFVNVDDGRLESEERILNGTAPADLLAFAR